MPHPPNLPKPVRSRCGAAASLLGQEKGQPLGVQVMIQKEASLSGKEEWVFTRIWVPKRILRNANRGEKLRANK